jgi:hypothetical protein
VKIKKELGSTHFSSEALVCSFRLLAVTTTHYRKVPGKDQKINTGLNTVLDVIYNLVSLGTHTAIISFLFALLKHRGSNFSYCCRVPFAVPFGCQTLVILIGFSCALHFLQSDAGIVLRLRHNRVLANSLQFSVQQAPDRPNPDILRCWRCRRMAHT